MSATPLPTINNRRQRSSLARGGQRRGAFRINLRMTVQVDAPRELRCGLRDVSFTGVGFDGELPSAPGVQVSFSLELPTYGALVPTTITLQAQVVRVEQGHTGLRFVDLDHEQARAIHELVTREQRKLLAARRSREYAILPQ
jgi:c-di-GMP-binding flagellar brake protein YcgR